MFGSMSIPTIMIGMVALLFSLTFHGSVQASAAYLMGDDTARAKGFMSLNPLPHFDLLGSLIFPLIGIALGGAFFGWGKMIPIQPHLLTRKMRMKISTALFCGAGLLAYVVLAFLATVIVSISAKTFAPTPEQSIQLFQGAFLGPDATAFQNLSAGQILTLSATGAMIRINVLLAVFHLLPVGTLDGAGLLRGFIPDRWVNSYDRYRFHPYAWLLILVLGITGLLSFVLEPISRVAYSILLPIARLILGV